MAASQEGWFCLQRKGCVMLKTCKVMDKCTILRAADNGTAIRHQVRANDMRPESRVF